MDKEPQKSALAIELMAPAGDEISLCAALQAGADAVYFGAGALNMRAHAASNFTLETLPYAIQKTHAFGAKAYITVNTVLFDNEMEEMNHLLDVCAEYKADAIIASDMAVIQSANARHLPVHLSVQCNICNTQSLKFYAPYATAFVPARELSLEQICALTEAIKSESILGSDGNLIRAEAFAHGALCVAFSGRCNMSLATYGSCSSANRGTCFQPCRRTYTINDTEEPHGFVLDGSCVMSPKDLCTLPHIDALLDAGISILKIEGRGRSAEYVQCVTEVYRTAIDAYKSGAWQTFNADEQLQKLHTVFNRGFWVGGYYMGKRSEMWSASGGNIATEYKLRVGRILHYYSKIEICQVALTDSDLAVGDEIYICGTTTGVVRMKIQSLKTDASELPQACVKKGNNATFQTPRKVRTNDTVYIIRKRIGEKR